MLLLEVLRNDKNITEPEFTPVGVLLPEDYYLILELFHTKVCKELDSLGFVDFMAKSIAEGIEPENGYVEWIQDAVSYTWITCLRQGLQRETVYPKPVAEKIIEVAHEMYYLAALKTHSKSVH